MIQWTTEWCLSIYELFKTASVSVVEKLDLAQKQIIKLVFLLIFLHNITQKYSGEWYQQDGGLETPTDVSYTKTQQNNKQLQTEENSQRIARAMKQKQQTHGVPK